MIDFAEINNYESFEDLCEALLATEGLQVRRLGRGPGQIGKDIIAQERIAGPLSVSENRKWLVECKHTNTNGSIGETDIFNVKDRIEAQNAYGYMLFTNCRLKVNLEKTLNGLNKPGKIGIQIWAADKIAARVVLYSDIFRTFYPISFSKWIKENRIIYINQIKKLKSPIVHLQNSMKLIKDAPNNIMKPELVKSILEEAISAAKSIVDDLDHELQIIEKCQ